MGMMRVSERVSLFPFLWDSTSWANDVKAEFCFSFRRVSRARS